MSANFLVFEIDKAPKDPSAFMDWFQKKAKWEGDRDYFSTKGTSQPLVDFYRELTKEFPDMNGQDGPSDEELETNPELESRLTDYTIDDDLIYMGFGWSIVEEAEERVKELAFQYHLGFSDLFKIYLDRDTVIPFPKKSPKESRNKEKKKSWLSKLFGGSR